MRAPWIKSRFVGKAELHFGTWLERTSPPRIDVMLSLRSTGVKRICTRAEIVVMRVRSIRLRSGKPFGTKAPQDDALEDRRSQTGRPQPSIQHRSRFSDARASIGTSRTSTLTFPGLDLVARVKPSAGHPRKNLRDRASARSSPSAAAIRSPAWRTMRYHDFGP